MKFFGLLMSFAILSGVAGGQTLNCDLKDYKATDGLKATASGSAVTLTWQGEGGQQLRASFGIQNGQPMVQELAAMAGSGGWVVLGKDLTPDFQVTTGKRRISQAQRTQLKALNLDTPEEEDKRKWNTFWDAPLVIPGRGDTTDLPRTAAEITRASVSYQSSTCKVATEGNQLSVTFDGLKLGIFAGDLRFIAYKGTNMLRQEAVASTQQPSVAYIYKAGLKGFPIADNTKLEWRDTAEHQQYEYFGGAPNEEPINLRARNRMEILDVGSGSLGIFPTPHKFFFAREDEVNVGFVYYRKDNDHSVSLGVMWPEVNEGYHPWGTTDAIWDKRTRTSHGHADNDALFNAPAGTKQRMAVYYYLNAKGDAATHDAVLAYTHDDVFKPVPGYKIMTGHFHMDFNEQLRDRNTLDYQPPFVAVFRHLGINILYLGDFHDDSHPSDPGPIRFKEQKVYFEGSKRISDKDFLVIPAEEPDAFVGGHWYLMTPKPIYYSHAQGLDGHTAGAVKGNVRPEGQSFEEDIPEYGHVYHLGSEDDVLRFLNETKSIGWTTHPRTKNTEGYPEAYKDRPFFLSDRWVGASWESLPVDLSEKEECEVRCFGTEDDMSNWSPHVKAMLTEGDTYTKWPDDETYPQLAVNYIKLDKVPAYSDDWSPILDAMRRNDLYGTNGEVLFHNYGVSGSGDKAVYTANFEYTFPLEFADLVWSDGNKVEHKYIDLKDTMPFGSKDLKIPFDATGKKWVRLSVWDSTGSGAWNNPTEINPVALK
jgi:hypothetical protein